MAFFKTITQGGQVHIHQLHMLKQILSAGIIAAFLVGGGYFVWKSTTLPSYAWRMAYETYWAKFMMASNPPVKHKELSQLYTSSQGKTYKRSCLSVLKDPLLKKTTERMESLLERIAYQSLGVAALMFLSIMALWFGFGRAQKNAHHKRGTTFASPQKLGKELERKNEASDLKLGELPLIKDKETSHILITGTTGSGKTNAFHILLPQIRERQNKAIIVDVTGNYVSRYYNEKTDLLLNPLDVRSMPWHPWADCHLDSHYDVLAESLIQSKEGNRDPFWDNASRAVLKTALRKFAFQGEEDVQKLYTFLLSSSDKEFEAFFKGTEAATFAYKNNEKTTHSIRSVLASQIEGLRQLETLSVGTPSVETLRVGTLSAETFNVETPNVNPTPFSIRKWVMDEKQKGWLFITARPDQRETLRPLISAWVDITINALMVLPENQQRRLWFIIDELTALQRLPRLQAGLAEGRKYGGCLLVGFQSKPQLEEIYGRNTAEAMLDLFNTKIFFRCTEPSTQQWISKVLGDKEEAESTETISYGAHSMRDGVSLNRQTRQKALIMPTELSQLKDLECYLKYPGDYPCTKIQTEYQESPDLKAEPFLLKPEKKREYKKQEEGNQPEKPQNEALNYI